MKLFATAIALFTGGLLSPPVFAEDFFRPGDVVAVIGGEDAVVTSEYGFLEREIQKREPEEKLIFRSLAWEGDTLGEQARMLNYPALDRQLEELKATVVVLLLSGSEPVLGNPDELRSKVADFVERMSGGGRGARRRWVIVTPTLWETVPGIDADAKNQKLEEVAGVIEGSDRIRYVDAFGGFRAQGTTGFTRDGLHLNEKGHMALARVIAEKLSKNADMRAPDDGKASGAATEQKLLDTIRARNRLWDRYRRPQNWAFLAGDRTTQPSSRDHRDPSKRWFPDEMKEFVPLIEAKDGEIWQAAAALRTEGGK